MLKQGLVWTPAVARKLPVERRLVAARMLEAVESLAAAAARSARMSAGRRSAFLAASQSGWSC